MTVGLDGGKKKKKKHIPNTVKKTKHKHRSVKCATLKYYSIDNSGTIKVEKKVCPNCGHFCAKH